MHNLNQIGQVASGLMSYEFSYIPEADKEYELLIASGTISGKLGELNVLINQDFTYTGDDGNPFPRLQQEEISILEQLYIREYNTKQAQKLLRGVYEDGTSGGVVTAAADWIELREGDTVIKRNAASIASSAGTKITLSKDFKALADDAARKIQELVYAYNMYGARPIEVANFACEDNKPLLEKDAVLEIEEAAEEDTFSITLFDTQANIYSRTFLEEGSIAYGTDTNDIYIWDGSHWYRYADKKEGFNIEIQDTQANIFSDTSQQIGVIAYGTDTQDLYVWDGNNWYIYNNN
jgi:hypothetical protein